MSAKVINKSPFRTDDVKRIVSCVGGRQTYYFWRGGPVTVIAASPDTDVSTQESYETLRNASVIVLRIPTGTLALDVVRMLSHRMRGKASADAKNVDDRVNGDVSFASQFGNLSLRLKPKAKAQRRQHDIENWERRIVEVDKHINNNQCTVDYYQRRADEAADKLQFAQGVLARTKAAQDKLSDKIRAARKEADGQESAA